MNNDMVSRQEVISIVTFECGKWTGLSKEINKQIQNLPSAEPELSTEIQKILNYRKTGRSFPQVAELLKAVEDEE